MLILMDNIDRVYRKGSVDVFALQQVNLTIIEGEFTAIMGPSGSGKSTLLHILGCLDRPSQGSYTFDGINISDLDDTQLSLIRNQKIGFVFQSFNLLPQYTVLQNIAAPLLYSNFTPSPTLPQRGRERTPITFGEGAEKDKKGRAQEIAERVGLGQRLRHRSSELSGGEMQRVAIARALITQPRVILADEPTGNLDSRTGQEIMNMLKELHEQGNTIIIVTHEKAVSEYAQRTIFLKDGNIASESRKQKAEGRRQQEEDKKEQAEGKESLLPAAYRLLPSAYWMLPSIIETAIRGILLHKLRSLLSVLGIVFGIGAIIAMLAIGAGARQEIIEQIALLGTNNISVKALKASEDTLARNQERLSQGLTSGDVARVTHVSTFMTHLAPLREFSAQVHYQRQVAQAYVIGTTPAYQHTGNLNLKQGRFLTVADEEEMQRVCVLGAEIQQALFAFRNPLRAMVKIRNNWFRVIGTLENKVLNQKKVSTIQMRDVNKSVVIPLSTSSLFVPSQESERIQEISIRVDAPEHVNDVARLIRTVLSRVHHGAEDYEVSVPRELLKQSQQAQNVFNVVMGSIAGISLLVGGIGIMNIMLATVTERTREIGVRRAIGASRWMILLQFLIETLVLTLVGGGLGIALGIGGAYIITVFAGWPTIISLQTILLAFGVSALIGIVFGMYPASQGAKMDPITAFRYE